MIEYESGYWQISFIFRCRGSVFPKAFAWAGPVAVATFFLSFYRLVEYNRNLNMSQVWSAYNFTLGFLLVFRTQQAYSRFWEGATILQQVRGEWFNAVSSCFAFCSSKAEKQIEVERFQHFLARLMSLLYCTALQQIAVLSDEAFEVIDVDGIDEASLVYLSNTPEKCLVLLQWIQRLIIINAENGVITAAPPILSRVFQELSRGIVNIVNAQKITDVLFPFPYAQMVTFTLVLTTLITPIITAMLVEDFPWAAGLAFISVFVFWAVNYIAAEIEMPFGEDANDLPIAYLQEGMNISLRMLLDDRSKNPPAFNFVPQTHWTADLIKCPYALITDVQHTMHGPCLRKLKLAQQSCGSRNSTNGHTASGLPVSRSRLSSRWDSDGKILKTKVTSGVGSGSPELHVKTDSYEVGMASLPSSTLRNMARAHTSMVSFAVNDDPDQDITPGYDTKATKHDKFVAHPVSSSGHVASQAQAGHEPKLTSASASEDQHELSCQIARLITRLNMSFSRISAELMSLRVQPDWCNTLVGRAPAVVPRLVHLSTSLEEHCRGIAAGVEDLANALGVERQPLPGQPLPGGPGVVAVSARGGADAYRGNPVCVS